MIDRKFPVNMVDCESSEDSDDSEEEYVPALDNSNNKRAEQELNLFESFKRKKFRPKLDLSKSKIISSVDDKGKAWDIAVGPVLEKGKDLPSGKNLAKYVGKNGYFALVEFFSEHKKMFPTLWTIVQCEASRSRVEVGCERFFSVSGYVSAPRRTKLGVRTYERLALMSSIINKIYIDKKWVAKEYLRRCKEGSWDAQKTEDALKCWNLERVLDAELMGKQAPEEMTLEDFLKEE